MSTELSPPPARQRAPHLGPERRRPQVLDAALAIAAKVGLPAITIGSIAKHLGVTRPVVYACFADRNEIVEALLDREGETLVRLLLDALHESGGHDDDPEQAFVAGFTALLRTADARGDAWRLVFSGDIDADNAARLRSVRAMIQAHATAWIRPAASRWWGTTDLERKLPVLMELFMASCETAVRLVLDQQPGWSTEELGEFFGRAMFRAFKDA